jgi:hypothetical protein
MTYLLKNATLFVGAAIVAIALADPAIATPLGVSEIAKTKELTVAEGTKNHGAIVSEAARQHGGGVSSLNSQSTSAASSSQSVPEPGTLLLLGTGFFSLMLWQRVRHRFST